jgi:N-acetyl-gamma-glutamyl-phosphate reductase
VTRLALIGGRGHTGAELLRLLAGHDAIELALASSGSRAGMPLREAVEGWQGDQRFVDLAPDQVGEVDAEVWVLAVPNGASRPWVEAITAAHPGALLLDLGADHRFDPDWTYGLTEWHREALRHTRRITNPGCYATAAQLALLPLRDELAGTPVLFGVSGHSGAGATPSPRNDPRRLRDNLLPYGLCGHVHEREVSARLERPVRFHPHVAAWFRGISMTVSLELCAPTDADALRARFAAHYEHEALVHSGAMIPEVAPVAGSPHCLIGGFSVDERDRRRAVLVTVLDNLGKGAASQALQNLNLALGLDELHGLDVPAPRWPEHG